ncbi:YkoP family protein [Deinococcus maricopensis]|uniref:Polysaccharide deacetylase n=1 Tax=Deinococcus maricopensis (strain DSM 21211 / LMG 22137 / NRRL B-23946 / LB-34) TaxID=709986 RepID=E8U5B5_DEIML|nr:polysaccharide deacetylase family protein [Deinococcus maricopensis]ADV66254.1 polysaccharide deacetylase [Deinococcus maricopensis DSM 21211]
MRRRTLPLLLTALAAVTLPRLLHGPLGLGVVQGGHGGKSELALTFNGVPGTNLLAVLRAANVPATFFLKREEAHPELLAHLRAEGHQVALRGGTWRYAPMDGVTHVRPDGYTPLTVAHARRAHLTPTTPGVRVTSAAHALDRAEPGAVLTLPLDPTGLADTLQELRARGYTLHTVDALYGPRRGTPRAAVLRAWRATVDARFDRQKNLTPLTTRARALFRLGAAPYEGPSTVNAEGRLLPHGAPGAELHLHNGRFVAVADLSAITALRAIRDSLRDVAHAVQTDPRYADTQVVWALTLFHDVLGPLGFTSADMADPRQARLFAFGMDALRRLYGARATGRTILPKYIVMDRQTLLERYGQTRG